jgi:ketosteroid isomerase-like protein
MQGKMVPPSPRWAISNIGGSMKLFCLIAAVLFGCGYITMAQSSTSGDLIQLENRFNDALVRADLKTINEIEADDLIFTDATGTVTSKADEMQSLKSGDVKFESIQMTDTRTQDFGDIAVVTGRLVEKAQYKNSDISGTYRFTDVWAKRKSKWEHVAGQETLVSTPAEASASGASDRDAKSQEATMDKNSTTKLVALTNEWTDAINSRNRQKLDELMASDFALYHWNGQLGAPRAQWLDNLFNHIKITKNTLTNAAPQLYGDFGVVTSVGDWIGTFDSKPFSQECIVVDTWRKIENQWKVVRRTSHCYTEDSVYGRVNWSF